MNKYRKKITSELYKGESVWYNITSSAFRDGKVLDEKLSVLLYVLFPKRTAIKKHRRMQKSTQIYFNVCCVHRHW